MQDKPPRNFALGLDIGMKVDNSALCVVEIIDNKCVVKILIKYPLGTPWETLYETVVEVAKDVASQGTVLSFNVDATGVGAIPADVLRQRLPDIQVNAFKFTSQTKRELIGKVKVLHTLGKLKFARRGGDPIYNQVIQDLITEMRYIQAKIMRGDTNDSPEVEVFKTGTHDDLFTALALAIKDIDINIDWNNIGSLVDFVEDKTWTKTPLDTPTFEPIVFW